MVAADGRCGAAAPRGRAAETRGRRRDHMAGATARSAWTSPPGLSGQIPNRSCPSAGVEAAGAGRASRSFMRGPRKNGTLVTAGGRVLGVTRPPRRVTAVAAAYAAVGDISSKACTSAGTSARGMAPR